MSRLHPARGLIALVAVASLAACEAAKSPNPTAPSVAGPIPGVAITAPKPLEPHAGQTLTFSNEPPTLLIENAGSSGVRTIWLQLEVSTDAGFSQLVHQADQISPGDNGRTLYRLPAPLGAGFTYYWRSRASDGANTGPFSSVSNFSVVPPVVIDTPTPMDPQGNINTNRPTFRARNANISGTTGVAYRFQVATNADMTNITAVVTAPPGGNGNTEVSLGELPYNTTFFWRGWGTDGTVESARSNVVSFRTPAPPAPTPVPAPGLPNPVPGGGGGNRTPDPTSGRLPLPGYGAGVVQAVAAANPGLLRNSCQEHGGSWQFLDLVVDTLRTYDTRWGYNGKRGNANDPSLDVVTYHHGAGASNGSTQVYIIDVVGGHCGSNPSATWIDVTDATYGAGTVGRWITRGRF